MEKKIYVNLLLLLVLGFSFSTEAQNLIYNPSFEEWSECPRDIKLLENAFGWKSVGQTVDLFDDCGAENYQLIPNLFVPKSAFGSTHASFGISFPFSIRSDTIFREYLQGSLTKELKNKNYYLSFNVLARSENRTNHLDVYFSPADLDSIGPYPKGIVPQFELNEWIGGYDHWQLHEGCLDNISGANYFTVGNFQPPGTDEVEFPDVEFSNRIYIDNFKLIEIPDFSIKDTALLLNTCLELPSVINQIPVYHTIDGDTLANSLCSTIASEYNIYTFINGCNQLIRTTRVTFGSEECKVYAPNVFSPNYDGVNDQFTVYFSCFAKLNIVSFQVFDRWGAKVYQSLESDAFSWDGTFNGKPLPVGVYVWMVEYETIFNGQLLRRVIEYGDISVVR